MNPYNTIQKLKDQLSHIEGMLEDMRHSDRWGTYVAVNVKLYDLKSYDTVDIADKLKEVGWKKKRIKKVLNFLNDDWIQSVVNNWIEWECEYLSNDWVGGCTVSSREYWSNLMRDVLAGKPTNYPVLEELTDINAKVEELQKWIESDAEMRDALKHLDNPGFFGRSSGWFALAPYPQKEIDTIRSMVHDLECTMNDILIDLFGDEPMDVSDYVMDFHETVLETEENLKDLDEFARAMKFIHDQIKKMVPTDPWDEILFRIEEIL